MSNDIKQNQKQKEQSSAAQTQTQQQDKAAKIEKIQQNLIAMKEAREAEGISTDFFSLKDGQKTVLEFTGDFEPVLRQFKEKDKAGKVIVDENGNPKMTQKMRYEYKILDYNNTEKGIQTWPVSKNVSKNIDQFLEENLTVLKVTREGADMGTKYYFVPVQQQQQQQQQQAAS